MNTPFDKFNPNTTRWVPGNALALANAAQLAYSDASAVAAKLAEWGFDPAKFEFLDRSDTQGFVAGAEELVVVSFRGTQSNDIWDWMTDADVLLRSFPAGLVHKGFYQALDDVWDEMNAAIKKFQDHAQSLWFTGHSLGAALACMAVARLVFERHAPINGLYTFGQPRTGDFQFSHQFDHEFGERTFRFVNHRDIVTRIPLRLMGYSHVGNLMFFDQNRKLQTDDHFWNKFLVEVRTTFESMEKPKAVVEDHAIQLYVDNVQTILN